jgi:hypothetical protein
MRLSGWDVGKTSFPGMVFERVSDCVIFSDLTGAIVFANSAAYSLFGAAADAAPGPERIARCGLFFPDGELPLSLVPKRSLCRARSAAKLLPPNVYWSVTR